MFYHFQRPRVVRLPSSFWHRSNVTVCYCAVCAASSCNSPLSDCQAIVVVSLARRIRSPLLGQRMGNTVGKLLLHTPNRDRKQHPFYRRLRHMSKRAAEAAAAAEKEEEEETATRKIFRFRGEVFMSEFHSLVDRKIKTNPTSIISK